MRRFRSWIALACLIAWNTAAPAQEAPPAPAGATTPHQVDVYVTEGQDETQIKAQPAPTEPADKGLQFIYQNRNGGAPGVQDYLVQEVVPNVSEKVAQVLLSNAEPATQWPLFFRGIPNEQGLGASFEPAAESVRSQLGVPAGQGLVVTSIAPGGPAARIGIAANDILLTLDDKPLGTTDDLAKALKGVGEEPVSLKLLRAGKPLAIQVKPEHHVTLGPVATVRSRYVIGVQLGPVEGALRAHLGLPDQQGLLVTRVEEGSVAQKAGLTKNDVLLAIGDKPLNGPEGLITGVQESGGKPITLKYLRAGKTQTVELTPAERKEALDLNTALPARTVIKAVRPTLHYRWAATPPGIAPGQANPAGGNWMLHARGLPADRQFGDLVREVKELRRVVEQLKQELKENESPSRKDK